MSGNEKSVKYHISDDGMPRRCKSATTENCPKSQAGDSFHGSLEEATIESERRFSDEYGNIPNVGKISKIKTPTMNKEFLKEILGSSDAKQQLDQGEAILKSDYETTKIKLREISIKDGEDSARRNDEQELPYPDNYGDMSREEKDSYQRSIRPKTTVGKDKIEVLEELYSKYPNKDIETMLRYHRGESDEWPTFYNIASNEAEILGGIPQYSDDRLASNQALIEVVKSGEAEFKLTGMDKKQLSKLSKDFKTKGLVIEQAASIEVNSSLKSLQDKYAKKNGVASGEGRELLYHGTPSHNIVEIAAKGFEYEAGVTKGGVANGAGFYFSSDPTVASAFGGSDSKNSGYIVICEVLTGGDERTQEVKLKTDYSGRGALSKVPKTFGKTGEKKNLARRTIVQIESEEDYEETFVKDAHQIIPVGVLKVRGASKKPV